MRFVGFDIETAGEGETYGLQPYRVKQGTARITSYAFAFEGGSKYGTLNPTIEELRESLNYIATQPDIVLVGWNTQFDVSWLIACGLEAEVRACRWADGEVMRRALENDTLEPKDKSYGLKATVAKYLPEYAGYEQEVAGNFDKVDDTLLKYNMLDAELTAKLARIFWDKMDGTRRQLCSVIWRAIVPVAGAWVEGIPVHQASIAKWEEAARADRDEAFPKVMSLGRIHQDDADVARAMMTSPVKLKKFLHARGVPVKKTDQTELSKYWHIPMVKAISDWKKANTAVSKFIKTLSNSIAYNQSDRTHPSCRLWNTYTGRFGYTSTTGKSPKFQTGFAIHQMPRKKEARDCICAPEGMLLAEFDFATQESRLLCDVSGDPLLYDIFSSGKDFHTYMAAIIAGIEYENMLDRITQKDAEAKNYRQLAKVVNLSCAYRTGWKKLIDVGRTQYDVIFDEATAKRLHGLFRTTYHHVPIYWKSSVEFARNNGYAETRGGRRVYIDNWVDKSVDWESESTAINFPIQGTGADMKFLGIAAVDQILHENGGRYMLDLHDALFVLLPDTSQGHETAGKVRDILSNLPYKEVFGWSPRVKLPVDLKIGKQWGSLTEIKA
jgi:DNA polymerase I-like protein with 3'-5' exonuclease and polymerase domains